MMSAYKIHEQVPQPKTTAQSGTGNVRPADMMPKKDAQSSSCEYLLSAPGADIHFLDMHVSYDSLEKHDWHSLAPKRHDW